MTRIDWVLLKRVASRVGLTILLLFALMALVESLDSWRFGILAKAGGPPLAILGIVAAAARWSIKTMVVAVLLGTILALLDLQRRRELTAIKSAGISVWRSMRAPVLAAVVLGLGITFVAEGYFTDLNRSMSPSRPGDNDGLTPAGELWLDQSDGQRAYVIDAVSAKRRGTQLSDVSIFFLGAKDGERLVATDAKLADGEWQLSNTQRLMADKPIEFLGTTTIKTTSTASDLRMKLGDTDDFTLYELGSVLGDRVSDPLVRASATMRFYRLLSQPLLLASALLIAFAFTAGYRRTDKFGGMVLSGIILGFIVFVLTEMADRAGAAGVLDPVIAAVGPAFVAVVIGVTVLLFKEDGRA